MGKIPLKISSSVGHGQSEGSRVHIDDFQEYVDDGILHAQKIQKDFPHTPMFVLGHSMVRIYMYWLLALLGKFYQ